MAQNFAADFREMGWLLAKLSCQRGLIADLLRQLAGLSGRQRWAPRFWQRFLSFAADLAKAQEEEAGFLSRIEKIEERHRFDRQHKKLKRIMSARTTALSIADWHEDQKKDLSTSSDLSLKLFCLRLISAGTPQSI